MDAPHTREDCGEHLQLVVADQDEHSALRRLLDDFQQFVGRLDAHALRKPYDEYLVLGGIGRK